MRRAGREATQSSCRTILSMLLTRDIQPFGGSARRGEGGVSSSAVQSGVAERPGLAAWDQDQDEQIAHEAPRPGRTARSGSHFAAVVLAASAPSVVGVVG